MSSRVFSLALRALEKGSFPRVRKWGWKRLYNGLGRFWTDADWRFMNYGHMAPDDAPFVLRAEDESERAFIGLYHQAVAGLDVAGKRVLEIGSGRGGGCSYIARYFEPAVMVGVDFSPVAVDLARRLNQPHTALEFRTGDAERLAFADASFDIVINVESSHCYGDMHAFVAEAARVLKPGGILTWADMRAASMIPALDRHFSHPTLKLVDERSLSKGVLFALDRMNERKLLRLRQVPVVSRFMMEFAGTRGSMLYRGIKSGSVLYISRRYRKQ
jgi:SAM-dependent methyltransferase